MMQAPGHRIRRRELIALCLMSLAAPRSAGAQASAKPRRIAVLMSTAEDLADEQAAVAAFVEGLDELGWTVGRNLEISYRWGHGDAARMAANAREIVVLSPELIFVKGGNLPSLAALNPKMPIVFQMLSDAVAEEYVGSLAHPGGNITGFTSGERDLVGKRLQFLREIVPAMTGAGYLRSQRIGSDADALYRSLVKSAAGLPVADLAAGTAADIEPLIAGYARQPNRGLVVAFDAFTTTHTALIVSLAAKYRLPAIYPLSQFAEAGGLVSYGFDETESFRHAAGYVDRILRGAKPSELPVQEPTRFQLVINGKTATTLGLSVPPLLSAQAAEVIE